MSTPTRDELAHHEAGHAVAGVLLGGRLHCAVVTQRGDVDSYTRFAALPIGLEPSAAYGGCWAQAHWRAGGTPTMADLHGVLNSTGVKDREVLTAAGGVHVAAGVVPLLTTCWGAVRAVARKLATAGEVRHEDVHAALGLSADPQTAAIELAHIRAGRVPGSFTVTRPAVTAAMT